MRACYLTIVSFTPSCGWRLYMVILARSNGREPPLVLSFILSPLSELKSARLNYQDLMSQPIHQMSQMFLLLDDECWFLLTDRSIDPVYVAHLKEVNGLLEEKVSPTLTVRARH